MRFPATVTRAVIIGATCWALSIIFFVVQAIAIAASARPYDLTTNLISDLGNTACGPSICSPLHAWVNATFVVVGLLHGLGGLATYRAWPRAPFGYLGVQVMAIAGAGLLVAGLSPENLNPGGHRSAAVLGLITLNLAMLCFGLAVVNAIRWLGIMALVAGAVGLLSTVWVLAGSAGAPVGIVERLADYPGAAMIVVFGVVLLRAAISWPGERRRTVAAERTRL